MGVNESDQRRTGARGRVLPPRHRRHIGGSPFALLTHKLLNEAEPTLYRQIVNATRFPARSW